MWALVDVQKVAHPVSRAMTIIQARFPEGCSRQYIQEVAGRSRGIDGHIQGNMTLEDSGKCFALKFGWFPEVKSARDVRGTISTDDRASSSAKASGLKIPILSTAVAQVDLIHIQLGSGFFFRLIVDDSCIGSDRADGVKTESDKVLLFAVAMSAYELIETLTCGTFLGHPPLAPPTGPSCRPRRASFRAMQRS